MSEPIARRKMLVDYRIVATRCQDCGAVYFPPKSFCDKEGRGSTMEDVYYFYDKGKFLSGTTINVPSNKFSDYGAFVSGIVQFKGFNVPGRITDYEPPAEGVDVTEFIDRGVVPRFRRNYMDGEDGLVYYSSLSFSFADKYYPYQEYKVIEPETESDKPGIVGYGTYIPKYRIKNEGRGILGVTERSLPFLDEDTTTFSVETGKRALIHAAVDSHLVKKCFVGSESPTYAVKPVMTTVAQALEIGEKLEDGFFSGGVDTQFACKAASDLFVDAAALVNYPVFDGDYVMVIGADNSQAAPGDALDYTVGAGGTAYIFGKRDVIATMDAYVAYTSDTPDFYRREGQKYPRHGGRFTGEPAYYKHVNTAMAAIMKKVGLSPADIDHVVCHSPNGVFPARAARAGGFEPKQVQESLVVQKIGNLYSGSSLTGLSAVLDISKPGDRILMVSYGSGAGSDAYLFTVTDLITEKRKRQVPIRDQIESPHKEYVDYTTYRRFKEMS